MVGEIRDPETADIAITASLTGHFVFSTVHTNDAAGAITRLVDMGIEPFLVASSLIGLLAQRLVRRPCPECAAEITPDEELVRELGLEPDIFFAGGYELPEVKGSRPVTPGARCSKRAAAPNASRSVIPAVRRVYELLMVNDKVRHLTLQKADANSIRNAGIENGLVTLRMDGARKVMQGLTTPEEVLMVTAETEG